MHLVVDDLVDEMADSGTLADRVGPMVNCIPSGLYVFEELNSVDAGAIVVTGRPALVKKM